MKCKQVEEFTQLLFDGQDQATKAARIVVAILRSGSGRLSDIARHMPGENWPTQYKALQRFLRTTDSKLVLWRLFQRRARFVIGDVTEIARPQARNTPYVGRLKDGETRGFWLLVLSTPFRGRAVPFHFITYSSQTIRQEAASRNLNHCQAFAAVKQWLGDRPLVLDREFSYLELLLNLTAAKVGFVIRLHRGSHPPIFTRQGRRVELEIGVEDKVTYEQVWYKGQVPVNVIGYWKRGLSQPLWVMTNLPAQEGLAVYEQRMKIEESFRDMKSLLGLDRVMNKTQEKMEQAVALVLIAYAIGLLVGEELRDQTHYTSREWLRYSGLFLLLKRVVHPSPAAFQRALSHALHRFRATLLCPVPTYV